MKVLKSNNVTMRDIATRLGVSTATVSMVLSGKGRISAEVRQNILETAKQMGYETNRIGHALMMKNVTIGVMIPKFPAVVQENIKRGIADACKENKDIKFKCIIMEYEYDIADEEQCFQALYRSCDGIIIEFDADREEPHRDIIDKINAKGLPVVSIVVQPSRLRTSLHVSADAENIGRMAADVFRIGLRGNCSREVVIFGGKKEVDIHQRNIRGFREVCGNYQIDLKEIVYTNDAEKNIPPLVLQTFQKHPAVAGIFVSNYLAYRVCDVLRELGRADNVLVVGVDLCAQNNACVRDGSLHVLINQQQRTQAATAFNELINLMLHTQTASEKRSIQIPGQIILPGNLEHYID